MSARLLRRHAAARPERGPATAAARRDDLGRVTQARLEVPTDVPGEAVRDVALARGLIVREVCAIDEVWSGLKHVIGEELRRR